MKYNQPYGVVDVNASYVNGNPALGKAGSIPPGEGVEYPQREIVGVIQYAYDNKLHDYANALCQAPDNADLLQLLKAIFGIVNAQKLVAPKTLYVNGTTGDDDDNDGQAAVVGDGHGPYATIQKALSKMTEYNLSGFTFTIMVADGAYAGPVDLPLPNGSGSVLLIGNHAHPENCTISAAQGSALRGWKGGIYEIDGFTYQSNAPSTGDDGHGISLSNGLFSIDAARFLNAASCHIRSVDSSLTIISGPITIAGSAVNHLFAQNLGQIANSNIPPVLTIATPVTFSNAFVYASGLSVLSMKYQTITGAANVTGKRYAADYNAIVNSGGSGVNYFPGTVAGTTSTGGQYQ